MSVLIKDMEMSVTCCHCPLMGYDPDREWFDSMARTGAHICVLTGELIDNTKREDHCPLVYVPPHGRLIDADELAQQYVTAQEQREKDKTDYCNAFMNNGELCTEWWCVEDMLENAPTILEAEEGEA